MEVKTKCVRESRYAINFAHDSLCVPFGASSSTLIKTLRIFYYFSTVSQFIVRFIHLISMRQVDV